MKTRSAKAKGKRLEKWVLKILKEQFGFTSDEVRVNIGAETGADIKMASYAEQYFPFKIECKNQEAVGPIYTMYDQAISHCKMGDREPLLIIKKNGKRPLAVMDADEFFFVLRQAKYGR